MSSLGKNLVVYFLSHLFISSNFINSELEQNKFQNSYRFTIKEAVFFEKHYYIFNNNLGIMSLSINISIAFIFNIR